MGGRHAAVERLHLVLCTASEIDDAFVPERAEWRSALSGLTPEPNATEMRILPEKPEQTVETLADGKDCTNRDVTVAPCGGDITPNVGAGAATQSGHHTVAARWIGSASRLNPVLTEAPNDLL